eukprot:XP_001709592.1 Hypothetical protein GL50803_19642 [Giardia lamblia ATCC 50803]
MRMMGQMSRLNKGMMDRTARAATIAPASTQPLCTRCRHREDSLTRTLQSTLHSQMASMEASAARRIAAGTTSRPITEAVVINIKSHLTTGVDRLVLSERDKR